MKENLKALFDFKSIFMGVFALLFLIQCTSEEKNNESKEITVSFVEEFTIGTNDEEVILGSPIIVKTNSDGEIFISDAQKKSIMRLSSNGEYISEIGREGKGPGEFTFAPSFDIDSENQIHTLDQSNDRATIFSVDGEVLSTISPNKDEMVWSSDFKKLDNGEYLTVRKLREIPTSETADIPKEANVFQLISSDLTKRISSFGILDSLMDASNEFVTLNNTNSSPGNYWVSDSGDILFVPELYAGKIYRFQQSSEGEFTLSQTLESNSITEQPVEFYKGENPPN